MRHVFGVCPAPRGLASTTAVVLILIGANLIYRHYYVYRVPVLMHHIHMRCWTLLLRVLLLCLPSTQYVPVYYNSSGK